ncbi:unnamed protein product, partial [Mesorhabditis belari]|uniref:C2H2-type domain-containing protein n=1 Tax=Mesorhabditis belari TaxID=2138241 RepID=A0AAF3FHM9_9BILA
MSVPRFAVVKLKEGTDTVELYSILVKHGYLEVSFVEKLRDAPQYEETNDNKSTSKRKRNENGPISESNSPSTEKHPFLSNALKVGDCLKAILETSKKANSSKNKPNGNGKSISQSLRNDLVKQETDEVEASSSSTSTYADDFHSETSPKATATIIEKNFNTENEQLLLLELNKVFQESKNNQNDGLQVKSPLNCSSSEEEPVECQKCHVKLKISRMHCIRYHLAMHWKQKQFSCSKCAHSSHLNGNVKIHIKSNHPDGADVLENITDEMVEGWCQFAFECFPQHADKVVRLLKQRHNERKNLNKKRVDHDLLEAINKLAPTFMSSIDDDGSRGEERDEVESQSDDTHTDPHHNSPNTSFSSSFSEQTTIPSSLMQHLRAV